MSGRMRAQLAHTTPYPGQDGPKSWTAPPPPAGAHARVNGFPTAETWIRFARDGGHGGQEPLEFRRDPTDASKNRTPSAGRGPASPGGERGASTTQA